MAEAAGGEERIADLLRQWQESPTPRVGLQLAEEHRRLGRHADARAVLERSLEAHPGHLSSLVALGKTLLDLGETDAAAAQFERVVERDPTHLVAGKLLIEAHLRRGDEAGARERLDLYRLLNENDPEIEQLEARWHDLEKAGGGALPATAAAAQAAEAQASEAAGEPAAAAPAEPPAEEDAPGAAGDAAGATAGSAHPEPPATPRAPRHESGASDPFGPLASAGDERRWLAGLGGHGIFPVELPPEPAAEPEPEAGFLAAADEPPGDESTSPEAASAIDADPAIEAAPVGEAIQAAETSPPPEPSQPPSERQAAGTSLPPEPSQPADEERATNTLGELYLAQGHLADAERVFRAVLGRRPEDPAALAGLAEVERRRVAPLSATDLLEWANTRGQRLPAGGGRRDRSSVLLRAYLARLRRRSPADVP